ncbi:MAG: hypothetical protein JXR58_05350 [Bacteroidales bacterium]|nr:hypothetical protein [Bacteroidales bacterium]
MEKDEFKQDLEQIIKLFGKLKEKAKKTGYMSLDDMHYKQIEMLVQSYDMVKDNINEQMLSRFGEPIKDMMKEMINHLQEELGDEYLYEMQSEKTVNQTKEIADKVIQIGPSLEEIDRMLQSSNLSDQQINELLDLRASMKNQSNQ